VAADPDDRPGVVLRASWHLSREGLHRVGILSPFRPDGDREALASVQAITSAGEEGCNVRTIALRVGLLAAVGVGALIARPFLTGGAADLQLGDCFDAPTTTETVEDVQHHPCTDAHTGEVVFVGNLPSAEGTPYPDDATLDQMIGTLCIPAFDDYTGLDFETDPTWTLGYLVPLEEDWNNGDRSVSCYATRLDDAPTTGSIKKG
jgi:hypothetical protein